MVVSAWAYLVHQSSVGCALLMAIAAPTGVHIVPRRVVGTAMVGALLALAAAGWLQPLRLAAGIGFAALAPLLALPGLPKRMRIRAMAGCAALTVSAVGLLRGVMALPPLLAVTLACLFIRALPLAGPKGTSLPPLSAVQIRQGAHRITLTALMDSGNLLRDSVTGLPVVVISARAAARLGANAREMQSGMRLMSVRTVTGQALMAVFRPDGVYIQQGRGWRSIDCVIGVSPDGQEGFQALVPMAAGQ